MQEIRQYNWLFEELALFDSVHPVAEGETFLVDDTDPGAWVGGSIPHLLPALRQTSLQQLNSNILNHRC